jgi:hypothetical protein
LNIVKSYGSYLFSLLLFKKMAEFAAAMSLLCLQRDRRPDDDHHQYLIPKLEQQLPRYSDDNRKSISSIHSIISNNTSLPSPTILQKRSSVSSLSIRDEYSPERISNFHHDNEVSISDGESATTPGGRKRRKPIASIKTHRQVHSVDETKSTDYLQQQQQQQQHQQKPKRPYKCDRCDRPFARRAHLLRHIETTHENQKGE